MNAQAIRTSAAPAPSRIGVDVGGTFTDFVVLAAGRLRVHKRLTTAHDPTVAVLRGLDACAAESTAAVAHGSTVATNALLERHGARVALVTTRGFADVLAIGRQNRPRLYDLHPTRPPPLVPRDLRFEVDERMGPDGRPVHPLRAAEIEAVVARVVASGAAAVAVCLLFSFANPVHEQALGEALRCAGLDVSLSSDILPEFREFERTSTTVANAYLRPVMAAYLDRLTAALGPRLWVMQSDGTTVPPRLMTAQPIRAVLSGPAGGVIGALAVARTAGQRHILTLDMGGTSTDVSFCPGVPLETTRHEIGGVVLNVPRLDIHTVGAGGGSVARRDAAGALHVGPESAGADPGPACYGRGGTAPTVTDANLILGRLYPQWLLAGEVRLDPVAARDALRRLAGADQAADVVSLADAIIRVVNAHMERALRVISVERGHDPRTCWLVAFGGAGPLHAAELAAALDIPRVLIPRHPGLLSALGTALADVERHYARTVMVAVARDARVNHSAAAEVARAFADLERQASAELHAALGPVRIELRRLLDMRYVGQSHELQVPVGRPRVLRATRGSPPGRDTVDLLAAVAAFDRLHRRRYGHHEPGRAVEAVTIRVRARHRRPCVSLPTVAPIQQDGATAAVGHTTIWRRGSVREAPVYDRKRCGAGMTMSGPALVVQLDATTFIPEGWLGRVDRYGSLLLGQGTGAEALLSDT